jgi:hypothetical protein
VGLADSTKAEQQVLGPIAQPLKPLAFKSLLKNPACAKMGQLPI